MCSDDDGAPSTRQHGRHASTRPLTTTDCT